MVVDSCEPVEAKVFSDDELLADEKVEDTHTPPPLSNVLMTLSMSYASDSDGEEIILNLLHMIIQRHVKGSLV